MWCGRNKRVCIDLSCWIVQLQNVNKSHCSMRDKLYLRGLFHRLRALLALNCSLIFVTGPPPLSLSLLHLGLQFFVLLPLTTDINVAILIWELLFLWELADGSIPAIKLSTYRRRLNLESEVQLSLVSGQCPHCSFLYHTCIISYKIFFPF